MKKKVLAACLAAALCPFSGVATATPMTLNGAIPRVYDYTTLYEGSKYSGSFTATSLPAFYQINSASFSFTFTDDGDFYSYSQPIVTASSYGAYTANAPYYYRGRTITEYFRTGSKSQTFAQVTGAQEGASVTLAGKAVGSGATSAVVRTQVATGPQTVLDSEVGSGPEGWYSCGNDCSRYGPLNVTRYYSNESVTSTSYITDYTGSFAIAGAADTQSIMDALSQGNQIAFDLSIFGDLRLTSSQLILDVSELAPPSSDVPEPSTLWLLAGALGALAYSRRRNGARG